jgi:hypothetical protein
VVAWRPACQRWFVEMPDDNLELAPVFDRWVTAAEIAGKYQDGHAFFGDIPSMPLGTQYPRPNRTQPARTIDTERFVPEDDAGRNQQLREGDL